MTDETLEVEFVRKRMAPPMIYYYDILENWIQVCRLEDGIGKKIDEPKLAEELETVVKTLKRLTS